MTPQRNPAFNDDYLRAAANAERNMRPIPTQQQFAAQQTTSTLAQQAQRPVQQPPQPAPLSLAQGMKAKYGVDLPAAQSALTDRLNYLGGEVQKYGDSFADRTREVAGQGMSTVTDAGGRVLAEAKAGGPRGMRALAREGANALVSAGQAILPNAADVQEFGELARPVYSALTESAPPAQSTIAPSVAQRPITTLEQPVAQPTQPVAQPAQPVAQPAQPGWGRQVDINDVQSGEGVMRNATGTYGYRQMPNGDLIKFDAQGNQVGKLGNVGPRQQAGGMRMTSYGAMTPVDNPLAYETERRMAERAAAAEEAKLARLEELAMTGGGGDGTFEGMGNQKRIRRGAQAALAERTGMRRAQMADAAQRATQQMQNETTMRGQDIQRDISDAANRRAEDAARQTAWLETIKLKSLEDYRGSDLGIRGRETALREQRAQQHNDAVIGRAKQMRMDSRYDSLSDEAIAALAEQSMASRIPPEQMADLMGL